MDLRLKLEKFTENDFSYYFELVSNQQVMEMITERAIPLEEAQGDFEKLMETNRTDEAFGNFKITNAETNEFIGLGKLVVQNSGEAELGYMILPKYWGKGIAGNLAKQLIETAKKHPSVHRLFAIIDPKNAASRKILITNGFTSKEFKEFDGLPGEILERMV